MSSASIIVAMRNPPATVGYAAASLIISWILSAAALAINQLLFHGTGIGPGPVIGIASLVLQTVMIVLVFRRDNAGRALAVVFLVLAALPLPLAIRLVATRSDLSAAYLIIGFALKTVATALLFMGDSNRWFRR